jgi:hypothetical protein
MKNTNKLFAIVALAVFAGFSFAGCGGGGLNGTWVNSREGMKIVLNNGDFTMSVNNIEAMKGTYSAGGKKMTMTFTQVSGALLESEGSEMGLPASQWYTKEQLKEAVIKTMTDIGMSQDEAEEMYGEFFSEEGMFETQTGTYTRSGNTLTIAIEGEPPMTFTNADD